MWQPAIFGAHELNIVYKTTTETWQFHSLDQIMADLHSMLSMMEEVSFGVWNIQPSENIGNTIWWGYLNEYSIIYQLFFNYLPILKHLM